MVIIEPSEKSMCPSTNRKKNDNLIKKKNQRFRSSSTFPRDFLPSVSPVSWTKSQLQNSDPYSLILSFVLLQDFPSTKWIKPRDENERKKGTNDVSPFRDWVSRMQKLRSVVVRNQGYSILFLLSHDIASHASLTARNPDFLMFAFSCLLTSLTPVPFKSGDAWWTRLQTFTCKVTTHVLHWHDPHCWQRIKYQVTN